MNNKKKAVIIGAGPAGLTAAYELLKHTNIQPIIIEKSEHIGGISRTINYKNNRIDLGGHRFFSKSDRVTQWWHEIMPDMLTRNRTSRIMFNRTFFDYPLSLSARLLYKLGFLRSCAIAVTYFWRVLFPLKPEKNLEQFYINRFGDALYKTFFRDYTMKVWGRPCHMMSAEWGAQRAKGLSVIGVLIDSFKRLFPKKKNNSQKQTETSLITQFLYPPYGPGQLWESVAEKIRERGGSIYLQTEVTGIQTHDKTITSVCVTDQQGNTQTIQADYVLSSMPIKDLIAAYDEKIPTVIRELAAQLPYRDFLTVGLLINKKLELHDNWIYIQEPDVQLGRIQIFNNWSPAMVANPAHTWLGLEYFCTEGDSLWSMEDRALQNLATQELTNIGLVNPEDIIDGIVIRVEKAYPAYWGSYEQFDVLKNFLSSYENLFLIGRNGMHRYNNQDHSMLAAMTAVDLIKQQDTNKELLWRVNTEKEYHESR